MLLSRKLLNEINPIFKKISDLDLSKLCNQSGIEVEQIIKHPKIDGLVICYIEEVQKHPNADKLNVAQVRISKQEILTVVCGAKNICAKKYAIYAPIGTILPDGRTIEPKNIRGIDSRGMLCGYGELTNVGIENLSKNDAEGIILLDDAKLADTNIAKYINNDDVIFDLSIPSNRNDLNSVFNLEQELCFSLRAKSLLPYHIHNNFKKQNFKFEIDKQICSDAGFIYIKNFAQYNTTWKDKEILMGSGYKIHNNVLDLMNMFSLVFGNPIHVYNAQSLNINLFKIKQLVRTTNFIGLDDKKYEVPTKSIGIFHNNQLINVAGIIGDKEHMYNDDNNSLIIEVANFNNTLIRQTAQKMKISTKAQTIFSKPLSSWITQYTFLSICEWLKEHNIKFQCAYNFSTIKSQVISFKKNDLMDFIGLDDIKYKHNDVFNMEKFHVHPSRLDLQNQYDIYEEMIKIININTLVPKPINYDFKFSQSNEVFKTLNKLKNAFVNHGLIETKTYNLSSEKDFNKFNIWNNQSKVVISNPISKNREIMRISMIDEMLKVIQYNVSRKRQLFNIFEIQPIIQNKYSILDLSILFCTPIIFNKLSKSNVDENILNIKSLIDNAFKSIGIELIFKVELNSHINEFYNNQMTSIYWNNDLVGYIGQIKNSILKQYNIVNIVVFATSINIENIIQYKYQFKLKPISNFISVYRDINIDQSNQFNINDVIEKIKNVQYVSQCWVKDTFIKDQENTTYTLALKITSYKETLQTHQIDQIIDNIKKIIG